MFRFSALFPRIQPTGFIFHISRCGSTLLANALKTANQVLVVSEPRPVTETLLLRLPSGGADEPEKLVIKFTSINILAMRQMRTWWPDVPCGGARSGRGDGGVREGWRMDVLEGVA